MMALLLFLMIQASVPRAVISGSVVDVGLAEYQPLFDARVELIRPSGSPLVLRTDANGRFAFSQLTAGRYRLSVTRDGYQRKSASIDVAAGQQRNDVRIGLDVAPTLFGHVRDPQNIPITNILVEAIRVIYGPRGDRSLETVESALTDDRGEYHLYWLDPGDYYIRALPPTTSGTGTPSGCPVLGASQGYAPTYYPGFRDPADATPIRLRVGSNLSAFDFRIQTGSVVSLWGNISILSTGQGVGTDVHAIPAGAVASVQKFKVRSRAPGPNTSRREEGEFKFNGMLPGTYIISAEYAFGQQRLMVHRKVTLKAQECALTLKLIPGSSVNGSITFESGPSLDLRSAQLLLDSVDPDMPSPPAFALGRNGQFSVAPVEPGDYSIRFIDLPDDVYLKSARSGEVDIQAKSLRVATSPPEPIRVVLGVDGGKVDGVVYDSNNRPFAGADVVLVPDAERRTSPNQYRAVKSDAEGHFMLRGIPPGDYKMFAWQAIEPNAYLNDNYMRGYEPLGTPMRVTPNAVGTTSIRIIPMD
jgi:hypothetical protein